jgi:phosphatidylglycerophosphatase A
MSQISKYFVTIFGLGFIPIAPGTLGSIFAILVWYFSITILNIYFFYFLFILVFLSSFKLVQIYLDFKKKDDPSEVIIDEFIGQSLPLIFLFQYNAYDLLMAFCIFRFFDIFKIYPINKVENINGATGVIMDDFVAGIYTLIIVMTFKIILYINA